MKKIYQLGLATIALLVAAAPMLQAAGVVPVTFRGSRAPAGVKLSSSGEIEKITATSPANWSSAELGTTVGAEFSIGLWLRVESEELLNAAGAWNDKSPMTVFVINSADNKERLVMRLPQGKVSIASTTGDGWPVMTSASRIKASDWYYVVFTRSGRDSRLYINGVLDASGSNLPALAGITSATFCRFGSMRHFHGALIQPRIYNVALSPEDVQALAGARPAEIAGVPTSSVITGAEPTHGRYRAMRVMNGELHPLIDQLHLSATVVRWRAPQARDLLVCGLHPNYFGGRVAYFQQKGVDHEGLPFYDEGTTVRGLPGTEFMSVTRTDGVEELFAKGAGTPYGDKNLVSFAKKSAAGSLDFDAPRNVTVDGRSFEHALGNSIGGWWVGNIDDDGVPDMLVAAIKPGGASYWPDGEGMWGGVERENSGKGRGYDIQGKWLGYERTSILYWAKGKIDSSGNLVFVDKKIVHYGQVGFGVQWRAGESERALACIKIGGSPVIIHTGSVDHILAMPVSLRNGELIADDAQPLLKDGATLQGTYFAHSISVLDQDANGKVRLVLDGNPGHLIVLEGDKLGEFHEIGSLKMQGGPVAVDTLVTPARHDWDGDGYPDLILGDSSGWLTFWLGTKDPSVYHAGIHMTADGKVIHHQAGLMGSIQGPNEKRWGYLQPTVGDWDGDGKAEIITNDIEGILTLYKPSGHPGALSAPIRFKRDGKIYKAAWRSRPAVIPASMNYAREGISVLLHLDWDGELAVVVPQSTGATDIKRVDKLKYKNGKPVILCGPCGSWGRAELSVVDWNGDGKWDVVFGTIRGNQKFYTDDRGPGASPYWLENVGTNEQPVFNPARPIKLKDGKFMDFGIHTAAAFPTDLDNDSMPDLIVGAEDGKVYYFERKELQ